jgi:hypothetical protein
VISIPGEKSMKRIALLYTVCLVAVGALAACGGAERVYDCTTQSCGSAGAAGSGGASGGAGGSGTDASLAGAAGRDAATEGGRDATTGVVDALKDIVHEDEPRCVGVVATIAAGGPTTLCAGGMVTLTANAGSTYRWSTGATTQSIVVNAAGMYTVTVVDANGCDATSAPTSVALNALPTPTISASGPTTFCAGGDVTLTSTAAASYTWSTGATTQSIVVSTPGSYSLRVTDANGCSGTAAATNVVVNPLPQIPTISAGGAAVCPALTSSPATSYAWSTGATTQSIVAPPGSYTVTITDANGCRATSVAKAVAGAGPPPSCMQSRDPESGSLWAVCTADCNSAWISWSHLACTTWPNCPPGSPGLGGNTYHALQICQTLGYTQLGTFGGNCGNECGYDSNNCVPGLFTCSSRGPAVFSGGGNSLPPDQFGPVLSSTVMWNCLR